MLTNAGLALAGILAIVALDACETKPISAAAKPADTTVSVAQITKRPLQRSITVSSELVPFQEIDVYAKESGFVKQLFVDYGSHVRAGQVMATLEIPELEAQLKQDQAAMAGMESEITRARNEVGRVEAQHRALHLQYTRLAEVSKAKPGLVAEQEIDDSQSKDLASESAADAAKAALANSQNLLAEANAKLVHDQALYSYSKITAPFDGVITQRYANLGVLMQAGTSSSTQATPLVKLSQENIFRLVIPIPESTAGQIRVGQPVVVRLPALNGVFDGTVSRTSRDVSSDTRTLHTEVDIRNDKQVLLPGMYAEATITLEDVPNALVVPVPALAQDNSNSTVFVVTPDGVLDERSVKIGIQNPEYAQVLRGLSQGDRVVVSDRSGLRTGQHVEAQAEKAAAE